MIIIYIIFNNIKYYVFISMPVRTSAAFYRRGVSNTFNNFGKIASGNYTVGQPTSLIVNSYVFPKTMQYTK
jgi:hypothetical protein